MKFSSGTKVTALLAGVAFIASAGVANATIADEAKCRSTIAKNGTKLTATVGKNQRGCTKDVLKGKQTLTAGQKCHQNSTSDSKGKAAKADAKLQDAVGGAKDKCVDKSAVPFPITLAGFQPNCQVGAIPIATYDDVSDCVSAAAIGSAELAFGETLNPDYAGILAHADVKGLSKCVDAIAKNGIKVISTIGKERSKAQNGAEKSSAAVTASYDQYGVGNAKIGSALTKMGDGIVKACVDGSKAPFTTPELLLLGSCSADSVAAIVSCVGSALLDTGEGVMGPMYVSSGEFPATAGVDISSGTTASPSYTADGGTPGGRRNRTGLSVGNTGLGHNADVIDGFEGEVNLDCGGDGVCDISDSCASGNCRCAGSPRDNATQCDEPFGPDVDDCGGDDCTLLFGPPLALSSSGAPVCVVNIIDVLDGSVDLSNGASTTTVGLSALVYTDDGGQSQPCPICDGDGTANDGTKGGTCIGGEDSGDPCDQNGYHPTFGPSSYDCFPTAGKNISGSGLKIGLEISDDPAPLSDNISCGGPLAAFDCHCRVCSGDNTVPCNSDADCAAVAAGTCTANGGAGAQPSPNGCTGDLFVCGADGVCPTDTTGFCDGFLRASGKGILTCSSDLDCDALDTECPGGDCGTCSLNEPVPCFQPTIDIRSSTNAGTSAAVLGTNFCSPPSSSASINAAAGTPGPGSVLTTFTLDILCDDGITPYIYGGTSCP